MGEVTEDDYEILKQHFSALDNGGKGYLDKDDLASLITVRPGDQQSDDAVAQLMKQLDADKDGRVNNIVAIVGNC